LNIKDTFYSRNIALFVCNGPCDCGVDEHMTEAEKIDFEVFKNEAAKD
jgi:hypothetical protein